MFVVLFAGYAVLQYLNSSAVAYTAANSSAPMQQVVESTSAPQSAPPPTPVQTETVPIAQATTPKPLPPGQYVNGTYTGNPENAYYGTVQVQVAVSGGKIVDVQFLQYPNDRSTSRFINGQAMPLLRQEAIQAQSANVNGVSGASDTSGAFQQSLASALSQAKS